MTERDPNTLSHSLATLPGHDAAKTNHERAKAWIEGPHPLLKHPSRCDCVATLTSMLDDAEKRGAREREEAVRAGIVAWLDAEALRLRKLAMPYFDALAEKHMIVANAIQRREDERAEPAEKPFVREFLCHGHAVPAGSKCPECGVPVPR